MREVGEREREGKRERERGREGDREQEKRGKKRFINQKYSSSRKRKKDLTFLFPRDK